MFRNYVEGPLSQFVTRCEQLTALSPSILVRCVTASLQAFRGGIDIGSRTHSAPTSSKAAALDCRAPSVSTCRSSERNAVVAAKSPASVRREAREAEPRRAVGPMQLAVADPVLDALVQRQEAERRQLGVDRDELSFVDSGAHEGHDPVVQALTIAPVVGEQLGLSSRESADLEHVARRLTQLNGVEANQSVELEPGRAGAGTDTLDELERRPVDREHRLEDQLLALEPVVERRLLQPGRARDLAHGRLGEALVGEQRAWRRPRSRRAATGPRGTHHSPEVARCERGVRDRRRVTDPEHSGPWR